MLPLWVIQQIVNIFIQALSNSWWVQNSIFPNTVENIFPNSLINIQMEYLIHCVWNVSILISCKLPVLFSSVKLKLVLKFSKFMCRNIIGIFGCSSSAIISKFSPVQKEISEFLNITQAELLSFSQFRRKDGKLFFYIISLGCTSKSFPIY